MPPISRSHTTTHIVSCKKCKPNDLLTLFEQKRPPATFRPNKLLKSLFRTDKRTDRVRAAQLIVEYNSRDLVWLAQIYAIEFTSSERVLTAS
jgi:hypothetical protein